MDDILRRMLEIETRAEETVAAAAEEAERILADGAAEVASLRTTHTAETDRLVEAHLASCRREAEAEKAAALAEASERIEDRARVLAEELAGRVDRLVPLLARASGSGADE